MQRFSLIKPLYIDAFVDCERRNFDDLLKLAKTQNEMHLKIEKLHNKLLSFIIYWEFKHFIYVEHFAVNEHFRGKGYGTKIFQKFLRNSTKFVVLEVEPPENSVAKKRIKFYEQQGMILNNFLYYQPPYNHGKINVNMLIMSSKYIEDNDFKRIKREIFEKVYNVKI
jgi:ribosomal protein S18 acetylase RimI-like enzyme